MITQRTGVVTETARQIVTVLRTAREKAATGALADAPSLRRALFWATMINAGADASASYESCVVAFSAVEAQEELRQVFRTLWVNAAPEWTAPTAPAADADAGVQS